jgi:amino acid adenylation domain-containing protein
MAGSDLRPRRILVVKHSSDFASLLRWRAEHQPDRLAYRFLLDGDEDEVSLTYAELDQRARAIAAWLEESGASGERAIMLYPPGLDYVAAFFGCLYAGTVAVPAYPPDPARLERSLDRLGAIAKDAEPLLALTTSETMAAIGTLADSSGGWTLPASVATDEIPSGAASSWKPPAIDADSIAFLQYTSGSTATPRGVVVSHGNLMHNSGVIHQAFGHSPDSRGVSWLPPYHDMGLIGGFLQPLYGGFPVTMMSPVDFLRRPVCWLRAVSRFRATTSGGPNFAYELCVRKVGPEELVDLDLSDWHVAFNGAEPIRVQTLERFATAFEPAGFRREAFHPCYGLAEATLMVTGGVPWSAAGDSEASRATRAVSCGRSAADQRVVIAAPATGERCGPAEEGEIWVAGPSVARSYWAPELSREVFQGRLADTGEGPFLRTGDLGFLRDGELFVTGRIKDLIVVRGRNHYPQDIELTAQRSHAALRPGCGAAFTVQDGDRDDLVVAWELAAEAAEGDGDEVARAVRSAVAHEHDIQVRTVVLLPRGGIRKTSSGKIQRGLCAALYAKEELGGHVYDLCEDSERPGVGGEPGVGDRSRLLAAPAEQRRALLREYLCSRVAAACDVTKGEVDPVQPLLALGVDSLAVIAIGRAIEDDLGVALPVAELVGSADLEGIVRRLEEKISAASTVRPATPAPAAETALAHQQRTLWFLQQLAPGSSENNVAAALLLRGRLDVATLRRALGQLAARHAALRTTFVARDGEPVACGASSGAVSVREHDGVSADRDELAARLSEAASQPFDLARGPLLRVDLYHTAPGETVMLVAAHHIITDFWSMAMLVSELDTLYGHGRVSGDDVAATLPSLEASYTDFVGWQEWSVTGDGGHASRAYWTEELRGAVEELRLPRPEATTSAHAGTVRLRIGKTLTRSINERARAEGVTVYMVLLAAYQLLLHRYTGQEDILVGTPMAGRDRPEFERVVGYCMNPVAIRSQLQGSESVRDVLVQVRRRVIGALDHQSFPMHLLATGRRAGAPVFNTLFVFNRPPVRGAGEVALLSVGQPGVRRAFADLVAEPVQFEQREVLVDLHLTTAEIDDMLFATFRYRTDVLDDQAAHEMMRHFENVLTAIAADTRQSASTVEMLSGPDRERLLTRWSVGGPGYDHGVTVPGLIELRAAAMPDTVAITCEAGDLSYRELNERANRVAHMLARRGVGPGARIGLCLERSANMIIALLGALKSGAAYVPADPVHPRERIAAMFAEAGVAVILTQRHLADKLPDGACTIDLDDEAVMSAERCDDLGVAIADEDPVYLMYTSGSTGTPKGVVVRHRSLSNYVRFAAANFALSAGDRVLQFASMSFDASAQQIYATLISGATLVLRNDRMLSSPGSFLSQCARWSVTVLDLPTAYWHELVAGIVEAEAVIPATLRLVNIGGERAVPEAVLAWRRHVGTKVRLINNYGPTEATIVAVTRDLTSYSGAGEVPIGRPVVGCTAYVLDQMRQPVPAGAVGELYLGGAGLAHGYLGRPGLTAQSFVPHPFEHGSRLYRTGDLASFTGNGELVYRGRADRQLKLRGYRVEPGEIESVLREVPGIADALVVLRESPRRLAGYLVCAGTTAPSVKAVRAALRGKLPEYMVPSDLVTVPSFPLSPNGKVDVAALPVPAPTGSAGRIRPRTPAERFLAGIFGDVLGLPDVGADDDFFERGGQSLLATKVIARIRDRYGVDVPLRVIFEAPTPAGLADVLERSAFDTPRVQPPRPVPRDQRLPLSFVQEGIWFIQWLAPESTAYNVPRALRVRGHLDVRTVEAVFAALERRHEILRTTFPDVDGMAVQVVHPPSGIPVSVTDMHDMPDAERDDVIQRLILEAGRTPFDMANGPLIRVALVRFGPRDHVLIIVEHHLIHDGWAQGVFLRDFLEVYEALVSGREPRLPELTVQFADYAHWQRQALSGDRLDALLEFWQKEISGAPRTLTLPADRPRPPVLTFAGDLETLVIDGELGRSLLQFGNERGATLFMTMFSAFVTLLYRYSGQDDILVGVGVANRQRPEAENLLGMMINTVLLRAQMSGDMSFAGLLDDTRERCLSVYTHQDLPFGKLVQALRPERSLGHMPLCQVLFTFLDTPMPRLEIPGLKFEVIHAHNKTAKFDLNVVVQPHGDDRITVLMEYNADIFDSGRIRRMLAHFKEVLSAAIDMPGRPLGKFLEELG